MRDDSMRCVKCDGRAGVALSVQWWWLVFAQLWTDVNQAPGAHAHTHARSYADACAQLCTHKTHVCTRICVIKYFDEHDQRN